MLEGAAINQTENIRLFSPATVTYARRMDTQATDSALMLRYRDGDVAAFEQLYSRHKDSVYRYLLRMCHQAEAAEDVFQETWGKIIKARDSYQRTAKFTTFLYRVAHNCCIDHMRRNRRHAGGSELEMDRHAHPGESPEAETERALARQRLEAALLTLPDEQRDVFLLREEAGLNLDEIARVTGCKREAAKSRLRYASAKLRAAIAEPGASS